MNKDQPSKLYYLAIAIALLTALLFSLFDRSAVATLPYSQFLQLLEQQKVSDLQIKRNRIQGRLQEPIDGRERFSTVRVDPALSAQLSQSGVAFTGLAEDNTVADLAGWLLPLMVMLGAWFFIFRGFGEKQGLGA